jgi:DNA-binding response OmpR family regulator
VAQVKRGALRAGWIKSEAPIFLAGRDDTKKGMDELAPLLDSLRTMSGVVLIKPFGARELLALVESHLKMSQFRHEATECYR